MTRARRPADWQRDVAAARIVEQEVADLLRSDPRVDDVVDNTASFENLDFAFVFHGVAVTVDVKEKRQRYSRGIQDLWPQLPEANMFIVDETVFRRIVWQGGGGYLLIHDVPSHRWAVFGPWELTLARKLRYARWGQRHEKRFLKGKLLLDLSSAAETGERLSVDMVLRTVDAARSWRGRVEPYPIHGARLRELGS